MPKFGSTATLPPAVAQQTQPSPNPQPPAAPVSTAPQAPPVMPPAPPIAPPVAPAPPPAPASQPPQATVAPTTPSVITEGIPSAITDGIPSAIPEGIPSSAGADATGWSPGVPPGMGDFVQQMAAIAGGSPMQGGFDFSQFDMSKIETQNFRLIPTDIDVEAIITNVEMQRSKSKNEPMMMIELKVTFPGPYAGVKIWDYLTFGETSIWKFKSLCRACEALSPDGARCIVTDVNHFKDYVVRFRVKHDEYQGNTKNKVAGGYTEGYESPEIVGAAAPAATMAAGPGPNW